MRAAWVHAAWNTLWISKTGLSCDEVDMTAVLDIGIGYLSPWFLDNAHLVLYHQETLPCCPDAMLCQSPDSMNGLGRDRGVIMEI